MKNTPLKPCLDCISHLQSRIDALQNHIEHLKNFIIE